MARKQAQTADDPGTHYYPPGPVARAFLRSDAFVAGIRARSARASPPLP